MPIKKYKLIDYDFMLVFMVIGLTIFGIMAINSAEPSSSKKQNERQEYKEKVRSVDDEKT